VGEGIMIVVTVVFSNISNDDIYDVSNKTCDYHLSALVTELLHVFCDISLLDTMQHYVILEAEKIS
jgi:hypothetical protein